MDFFLVGAVNQLAYFELFGAAPFEGRYQPVEDVIKALVFAGFFEGDDVATIGHNTDGRGIALFIRAYFTRVNRRQMEAAAAMLYLLFGLDKAIGKALYVLSRQVQDVKSHTLGRFWSDTGKSLKFLD